MLSKKLNSTKKFSTKIIFSLYFSLAFAFLVFSAHIALAATINFSPVSGSYKVGDTINVKVYVGTNSKSVNAISASIKFPSDILSLSSISKTGSVINIWAKEPSFSNTNGTASFEGVVLSGYTGNSGNAITLIFKAKASGNADLKFSTASILANDGNGSEVLNGKGVSSLKISQIVAKPIVKTGVIVPVKEEIVAPVKDMTIVVSEIKNNTSQYSPNKFLITSPQLVADKSYSIQIDGVDPIIWIDDGSHIFQAPELGNGIHTIKVMAIDTSSNALSGSLNFSTIVLKVPTITYYPSDLYIDQFMVLKGIADPAVDIELTITNIMTGGITTEHVSTNSDGKFTYVPDNKMQAGTYSIIARAITINGISSGYMNPIQVINKEHQLNFFVSKLGSYITLLTPLIALVALLIVILLYAFYRIKRLHLSLNRKFKDVSNTVSKSFSILDEDAKKEIDIFRKIRENKVLNKNERAFLGEFKNDIEEAEKAIKKELKEI